MGHTNKVSSHYSQDYKVSAVKHYLESGKTQEEICEIFGCSSRSLMRWVDRYKNDGSIERKNRVPVSYKVKTEHLKFIVKELKTIPTITMEDLLALLKNKFNDLELSRRHLAQIVKDNYISLKQTHIRHEPEKRFGKDVDINKNLKEFYREIKKYSIDDIICIDETSVNALQKRRHCYSEVGKRCTITTTSQEVFKRYTAVMAMSSKGIVGWKLYEKGGMDSVRLIDFLNEYVTSKYKNKLIILDNASCHRNDRVKSVIQENNKLLYSVPYQHFTNAIENYFSVFKSKLQKLDGLTYEEIKANIRRAIKSIPITTYKNILEGSYKRGELYVGKSRKKSVRKYKTYKD